MSLGDVLVEALQRLLAEDETLLLVVARVIHALERLALAEQDQGRGIVREQPHVARVGLLLEGRDQPREIDERSLQRVVDHLARGHRDGFAAVFRLRTVLHAASRLRRFHLLLCYRMLPALLLCIGRRWCVRLGNRLRARLGGLHQLGDAGFDGLVRRQLRLRVELEFAAAPTERADDRGVARHAVALRVKQVAEKKVQGSRLPRAVANRESACRPLALSGLQEVPKAGLVERAP